MFGLGLHRPAARGLLACFSQLCLRPPQPLALRVASTTTPFRGYNTIHRAYPTLKLRDEQKPLADGPHRLLTLHTIADNPGARKKGRRVGRGIGSSKGRTCGRGNKGVYARRTLKKRAYEGGQTPLFRRTPKRGMLTGFAARPLESVNLWKLADFIRTGRIDPRQPITLKVLKDSGVMGNCRIRFGVKLLADGKEAIEDLGPLNFEVTHASETAKEAVEKLGGSVRFKFFNMLGLRAHLLPHKFHPALMPRHPGLPKPTKAARYKDEGEGYFENKYANPEPWRVAAFEAKSAMKQRKHERLAREEEIRQIRAAEAAEDAERDAITAAKKAARSEEHAAKHGKKVVPRHAHFGKLDFARNKWVKFGNSRDDK